MNIRPDMFLRLRVWNAMRDAMLAHGDCFGPESVALLDAVARWTDKRSESEPTIAFGFLDMVARAIDTANVSLLQDEVS